MATRALHLPGEGPIPPFTSILVVVRTPGLVAQLLAQAHARTKAVEGVMFNPEYRSRLLWRFEQVPALP